MIAELRTWLRYLLFRKNRDELTEEIRFHLEESVAAKMRAGETEPEARRQAAIEFGSVGAAREQCEEQRPGWWAGILAQDIRFALRGMARNCTFSAAVVLTLMLGIGSSTAVFTVVDRILFRPLPYGDPDRLVSVGLTAPIEPQEFMLGGSYYEWQDGQRPFVSMTSETGVEACDLTEANPLRLACAGVEQNFLPTLEVTPVVGRNFLPEEDRPNAPKVALISYGLWRSRFNRDLQVAGRTMRIDGVPTEIVGVLPRGFEMPRLQNADVLVPEALDVAAQRRADPGRPLWAFARLKPGVTAQEAKAELEPLFQYSLRLAPAPFRKEVHDTVRPLRDRQFHNVHGAAWILFSLVMAVLLIACANVAGLLTARRAGRRREMAVRAALGASRWRLMEEATVECLLLSAMGGGAGAALAGGLLHLFVTIAPEGMPFLSAARMDGRVLLFTLSMTLLCSLGFAAVSGLQSVRLQELTGRGAASLERARLRQLLVTAQIAASLVLVAGGMLLARSFWNLEDQSLGLNDENVVTASITLGQSAYPTAERQMEFFEQLERSVRWGPGVHAVTLTDTLPPGGPHHDQVYAALRVEGQPRYAAGTGGNVAWRWVTPEYFRTLNIPMIEGGGFTDDQLGSANHYVVLSRMLADRMFAGKDPLGQQVHLAAGAPAERDPAYTVVGVAADVKNGGLAEGQEPEYYRLRRDRAEDWDREAIVAVKSNLPATTMERWLREQVGRIDPSLPVEVGTLQSRVNKLADQPRFEMLLVGYFACVGLLLAVIGLYGVTSFLTAQRRPEMGLRIALGASKADIARLVLGGAMRMVLPGTVAGLALAFGFSRVLTSMLFNVGPHNAAILAGSTLLLMAMTVLATLLPAMAATRVDPMIALRVE